MSLVKTSLLNAVAVSIRLLTLICLNKIFALYVGPTGYAIIGQLQNAITIVTNLASGATTVGVTKYVAEFYQDTNKQIKIVQTAFKIGIYCTIFISLIMVVLRKDLAQLFLKDKSYSAVFVWFSFTLFVFVFNSLVLAILNGKKEIRKYVVVNISGSIVGLIVAGLLVYVFGLFGALIALVTNQSIVSIVSVWICRKEEWFSRKTLWGRIDKKAARELGKFTLMTLTTAIVMPVSHMLVRSKLVSIYGWEGAGYWDGVWRISAIYLMFVTTTLGVYYLPRLSEVHDKNILRKEVFNGYRIILPFTIASAISIYLARDFIINILFTENFSGMRDLFLWQIVGDVVKIASWLLGYICAAKALTKLYIFSEILFSFSFVVLVYLFIGIFGLESAVIAHCCNYIMHFLFMLFSLRRLNVI